MRLVVRNLVPENPSVSIHIRRLSRMRQEDIVEWLSAVTVSIHIRRLSRMRRPGPKSWASVGGSFNPHPAVKPDETPKSWASVGENKCFNPHPAVKPDETPRTISTDRYGPSFNPHPAVKPDETCGRTPLPPPGSRFNPHPAVKPDETIGSGENAATPRRVSIHIRRLSRMRRPGPKSWASRRNTFQSTSGG